MPENQLTPWYFPPKKQMTPLNFKMVVNDLMLTVQGSKLLQGSKLRGAEGQNAPKLSPNAPRLLNLGAKFCYPIQPDICFEA